MILDVLNKQLNYADSTIQSSVKIKGEIMIKYLKPAPTFAVIAFISSCVPNKPSGSLKVANGIEAKSNEFPSVIVIRSAESLTPKSIGSCTATAVSSRTLLTASHCLYSRETKTVENAIWIDSKDGEKIVADKTNIFLHPNYRDSGGSMDGNFDIAVVTFKKDVFESWVQISKDPGVAGDQITLVGFGITSVGGTDSGKKRYGKNFIKTLEGKPDSTGISYAKDTIVLSAGVRDDKAADSEGVARGEKVTNLQGDSGGPIFLKGSILGVASTVGGTDRKYLQGNYISTYHHREWLRSTGTSICGVSEDCPRVPTTDDEVKNQGQLPAPDPSPPGPKPTPAPESINFYAAIDGSDSPRLRLKPTFEANNIKLCLGSTPESATSCSEQIPLTQNADIYSGDLGSRSGVTFGYIKGSSADKEKTQLIKFWETKK
jgi:hypothetical protein